MEIGEMLQARIEPCMLENIGAHENLIHKGSEPRIEGWYGVLA